MKDKYTPGPWQVNSKDPFQVCDSDGESRGCAPIAYMEGTAAEKRANARLIAAAPDMLAALQRVRQCAVLDRLERVAVDEAIAKATGGAA